MFSWFSFFSFKIYNPSSTAKHTCQRTCQPTLKRIVWEKIKSKLFKWSCRGSLKEFCLEGFFASLCQRKAGLDPLLGSCCHNSGWQFTLKILFSSFPGKQVKVKPTNCSWQVPYCCSLSFKLAIWVLCGICEWASRAGDNRFERVLNTEGNRRSSLTTYVAVWHHNFRQKGENSCCVEEAKRNNPCKITHEECLICSWIWK